MGVAIKRGCFFFCRGRYAAVKQGRFPRVNSTKRTQVKVHLFYKGTVCLILELYNMRLAALFTGFGSHSATRLLLLFFIIVRSFIGYGNRRYTVMAVMHIKRQPYIRE